MGSALPALRQQRGVSRATQRVASQAVERAQAAALVEAARIEAVSYVAYVGMHAVASLSEVEGRLIARSPLAERRLALIGDVAAGRIAELLEQVRG